ncbi:MAG: hypothetical protein M3437_11510 [Chloroflexota bacterium]|nr:hypothetical protein [Chloroflexota bacterium]MDQ5867976.1 hypothetical protein [Chloroflexota bacterium]
MPSQDTGLTTMGLGYLNYLREVMSQPLGSWEGFYRAQSPSMNFALRYQLAFSSYALAMMSQRTPAYRTPYAEALRGAVEKMLHVAAWGYWRAPVGTSAGMASQGHVAVLAAPHQRGPLGPPSDPIVRDNVQYSGHLSTMLGLYEKVSGDRRFDEPFALEDPESGARYTYTHTEVAGRIYTQMRENGFGGVCCEKGMAYVPCNNYSLASNTLHDLLHGTAYRRANGRWLKTVRDKMVLKGPAVRGVFGTSYMKDLHLATPVAFNFTDVWGLAFLLPFDRPLARKLYGRFKKKAIHRDGNGAHVESSGVSERMEISDVPINTGFGLILAKGMGDLKLADALLRHATYAFDAGWDGSRYLFKGAPRTLHATALYALAECMQPGGKDFTRLFHAPAASSADEPSLLHLEDPSGRVGVFEAEYSRVEGVLRVGLRQVGDAAALRQATPVGVRLRIGNLPGQVDVQVDGSPQEEYGWSGEDNQHFYITVGPQEDVHCNFKVVEPTV